MVCRTTNRVKRDEKEERVLTLKNTPPIRNSHIQPNIMEERYRVPRCRRADWGDNAVRCSACDTFCGEFEGAAEVDLLES